MAKWASSGGMLTGRPPVSDMVDRANCVSLEESACLSRHCIDIVGAINKLTIFFQVALYSGISYYVLSR